MKIKWPPISSATINLGNKEGITTVLQVAINKSVEKRKEKQKVQNYQTSVTYILPACSGVAAIVLHDVAVSLTTCQLHPHHTLKRNEKKKKRTKKKKKAAGTELVSKNGSALPATFMS